MKRVALIAVFVVVGACKKEELAPPAPPKPPTTVQKEPGPPPPGTDADRKLTASLELAKKADDSIATLTLVEKELAPLKKAKVWASGKSAKKTTILTLDDKGATKSA